MPNRKKLNYVDNSEEQRVIRFKKLLSEEDCQKFDQRSVTALRMIQKSPVVAFKWIRAFLTIKDEGYLETLKPDLIMFHNLLQYMSREEIQKMIDDKAVQASEPAKPTTDELNRKLREKMSPEQLELAKMMDD